MKKAVKQEKVMYLIWQQQKTAETKDVYCGAKEVAERVVGKAQNVEWMEVVSSLQNDFQRKQQRFWSTVKASKRGRQKVENICDEMAKQLVTKKRLWSYGRNTLQGYFLGIVISRKKAATGTQGQHIKRRVKALRSCRVRLKSGKSSSVCGI